MCGSTVVLYRVYKKVDPFKVKLAAPRTNLTALNALNKGAVSYFTHMLLRITNLKMLRPRILLTHRRSLSVPANRQQVGK